MRRKTVWLLAVVLAALCIERAAADSLIPAEVSEAVPPEAAQLMADVGDAPEQSLWQGLRGLWTAAQDYVAQALHQRLSGAVVLLGVVLLCSVAESFLRRRSSRPCRGMCLWRVRWPSR